MLAEDEVCEPAAMDSEDILFLLYTSGSTGKPKGLVHTQAGYLLYAALTHRVNTKHSLAVPFILSHCYHTVSTEESSLPTLKVLMRPVLKQTNPKKQLSLYRRNRMGFLAFQPSLLAPLGPSSGVH